MCDDTNAGRRLASFSSAARRKLCQAALPPWPCSTAKRPEPSVRLQKMNFSAKKSTDSDELPALQLDLWSSQQVDIENYNVSASRLLSPRENKKRKL